ncbi:MULTISPECIES: MerR family transcriptional regulator [Vibrio]|uniref:MerR family transcriptional regulator n=1 Tax=Vibrio nitrifigilis TaxID=2789781 RepID=A0ABS0GBS5_9VIBR|nr:MULTISPECIES: MerR family transcriptional regulator [Vibrio]MBF8999867.1 MerR family transcriptional regulator [Vibrio nitrifigilis]
MGIRLFSIQEFSRITDISPHTLRFFDKINLLTPLRQPNGYRQYTVKQIAQAEVITLLQKAKMSNTTIASLLQGGMTKDMIAQFKESHLALREEMRQLEIAHNQLGEAIHRLEEMAFVKDNLNQPFCVYRDATTLGYVESGTEPTHIVDLFATIHRIIGEPSWAYLKTHGVITASSAVNGNAYPLLAMYVDDARLMKHRTMMMPAGRYWSVYSAGSMENNPAVGELIQLVHQSGHSIPETIYIQQVSGPMMEQNKQKFIVQILLHIGK